MKGTEPEDVVVVAPGAEEEDDDDAPVCRCECGVELRAAPKPRRLPLEKAEKSLLSSIDGDEKGAADDDDEEEDWGGKSALPPMPPPRAVPARPEVWAEEEEEPPMGEAPSGAVVAPSEKRKGAWPPPPPPRPPTCAEEDGAGEGVKPAPKGMAPRDKPGGPCCCCGCESPAAPIAPPMKAGAACMPVPVPVCMEPDAEDGPAMESEEKGRRSLIPGPPLVAAA